MKSMPQQSNDSTSRIALRGIICFLERLPFSLTSVTCFYKLNIIFEKCSPKKYRLKNCSRCTFTTMMSSIWWNMTMPHYLFCFTPATHLPTNPLGITLNRNGSSHLKRLTSLKNLFFYCQVYPSGTIFPALKLSMFVNQGLGLTNNKCL